VCPQDKGITVTHSYSSVVLVNANADLDEYSNK
jgi:hypothetical protein